MTQVKFWLAGYLEQGFFKELSAWADLTAQIEKLTGRMEKEKRKEEKKHGKVF